jgi:glycogen debranching enzyme
MDTAAGPLGTDTVTLVEGSSFCISSANGDIFPEHPHGVFHEDTRILSRWNLTVNNLPLEPLTASTKEPYRALFIGRVPRSDGYADSPLIVERLREVGAGILEEEITLRNYSSNGAECQITIDVEADFADLFQVKEARVQRSWEQRHHIDGSSLTINADWHDVQKAATVTAPGFDISSKAMGCKATIPPHGTWTGQLTLESTSFSAGRSVPPTRPARKEPSPSDRRRQQWVEKIPKLHMGNRSMERTLRRSYDDLGALRIEDPAHPERIVVAAGAPWFMTLFGRDSLWASEMALPVDPSLALGTLQTLADRQGSVVDPMSEEEPGKILHEVRLGVSIGLALGGKSVYYGSIDATPQFVMTLASVSRWGFAKDTISALLPHADRALEWIRKYGDKDGDGFIEYQRLNPEGLINQGWKDSWDGINFADGRLAEPPIALCEVQALAYSAFLSRGWIAYDAGDRGMASALTIEAAKLKRQFNEQFWMPERGYFAVALDANKRQVDACASNMGQCLWHGIIDDDKVPRVVDRLMSPDMFSGWGVRTLSTEMGAYNPASYHNGSVWPHDNAIIAAGLIRYGYTEEAQRISTALFEAAEYSEGRLPELFCGFSRDQVPEPVPYPTACSPQAWAATTPIMLVTSLMRYDAHISRGGFWLDPALPDSYGDLHITNAPMAGSRITIDVIGSEPSVHGLPDGITFHREHRPWLTELVEQAQMESSG